MRVKEEAKRGCGLIFRGVVVYVSLGMWGRFGSLWLGKGDGGVVGGVQQGALLGQEPKVGLLPISLVLHKKLV
jgi:hypothetical protein